MPNIKALFIISFSGLLKQFENIYCLIVDDEAVSFIGPRDQIISVRIIDHLPKLAQERRNI